MAKSPFRKAVKYAEKEIQNRIRGFVARMFFDIIMDTPVKTGNLSQNWNLNASGYSYKGMTIGGNSARLVHAESVYAQVYSGKFASNYTLSNETLYGHKIEFERWSSKAPNGMMNINVIKHVALFNLGG